VPSGSHVLCVGTMRVPFALCWSHVCHMEAMWEPYIAMAVCELHGSQMGAIWEWCVLYGSHVCHMGAGWSPMGRYAAIWELHAPDGTA
jgi:hypothetical protein